MSAVKGLRMALAVAIVCMQLFKKQPRRNHSLHTEHIMTMHVTNIILMCTAFIIIVVYSYRSAR